MKKKAVTAGFALLLVLQLLFPALPAAGYFPEDGFEPCWIVAELNQAEKSEQAEGSRRPFCYVVRPGDTLWGLARRWGVAPSAIAAANGIQEDAVLYPGERLVIPPSDVLLHRVEPGDTLWSLGRRYHVSVERLASVNEIGDPAALAVGMELIIPSDLPACARAPEEALLPARGLSDSLVWPLRGEITSLFGVRPSGEFHHGIDIAGDYGEPVRAADQGVVSFVGEMPCYGSTVILDHGLGEKTLYAHLQEALVEPGDFVEKGETIGRVGSSGRATGPHLHFEVRVNDRAVDPLPFLKQ